jgi:hypothetical protein
MQGRYILSAIAVFAVMAGAPSANAACTPTGFSRDNINLTAALINPPGTLSGDVDATGCNIGVYYGPNAHGSVDQANIHGANYYGVVNNGANVRVTNSTLSDIGESPLNGDQHGVAIYFAFGSAAQGDITGNTIWNYQKGGIVVNGPLASSNISQNTVLGQGPVNYIAQNGIQVGYGAQATVNQNVVYGNSYTGAGEAASGGIILVGGACYGGAATTGVNVNQNTGIGNDVGVWFSNLDNNCNPLSTPTRDRAQNNQLVNNAVNNTTGNGPTQGYQAGVSDQGDADTIQNNTICGSGYAPPGTATVALFAIDTTFTNNPTVKNNTVCGAASSSSVHADAALLAAPAGPARPAVASPAP